MDGLKQKGVTNFRLMWGRWFIYGGIICAIVTFIVSAWMGLFPAIKIIGQHESLRDGYGVGVVITQGFYNLTFYPNATAYVGGNVLNDVNLSVAGIVMIGFAVLSILLPLIGFGEAKQRAFIKSENQIFKWFLGFIIIMGILMMSAVFVGKPHTIYNSEAIYGSQYFKNSIAWRPGEFDFPTGLTSLYITPNTNYWILFGITMFGALAIVVFGVYTTKKIFFRQALHAQSLVRHKK